MIRRDTVCRSAIFCRSACHRIELSIHAVIEIPVHINRKTCRDVEMYRRADLSLRSASNRKSIRINAYRTYLIIRVIIIYHRLNIVLPAPVSDRSIGRKPYPVCWGIERICLCAIMKGIQSCDHIFCSPYCICLLVWIRHHGLVLPICRITGHFQATTIPDEAVSQFAENILFIAHILGNLIGAGREPHARIRQTAVPASIGIQAMSIGWFP